MAQKSTKNVVVKVVRADNGFYTIEKRDRSGKVVEATGRGGQSSGKNAYDLTRSMEKLLAK